MKPRIRTVGLAREADGDDIEKREEMMMSVEKPIAFQQNSE